MLLATIGGAPIPHVTSCNLKHLAMPGPPSKQCNTMNIWEWIKQRSTLSIPKNGQTFVDPLASQFQPMHNCSSGASAYAQSFHSKGGPPSPFWPCGSQDFPGVIPWRPWPLTIYSFKGISVPDLLILSHSHPYLSNLRDACMFSICL